MSRNSRVVLGLLAVIACMGALAAAAVPLYDMFCRVTGYGGRTNTALESTGNVLDEMVRVRFDANTAKDLPWTFRPMQRDITLPIGEEAVIFYEAINNSDEPITGMASYNVTPDVSGFFFNKIECFCFTEQTLEPGERVEMPVSFFVDPDIVNDSDARKVRDITLSYSFHLSEPSDQQAALDAKREISVN